MATLEASPAVERPPADDRAISRTWLLLVALAIAVAGVALRLIYLNARGSLWLDELYTVWAATRPSIPAVLTELVTDPHPPAYTLLMHGWLGLVGVANEPMIRFPSVLAAVAMLALVGVAAARVMPGRVALLWLALLAASPMSVAYSAEARPYALLLLLQTAVVVASLGVRDAPGSRPRWILLVLAGVLASSVHYYGALASAINAAAFGLVTYRDHRNRRELVQWAVVGMLACVPAGAWLASTLALGGGPFALTEWLNVPPATAIVRDVLAILGNHRRDLAVIGALVGAGLGVVVFRWMRAGRPTALPRTTPLVVPLAMVIAATFGFALAVTLVRPIWSGRYFIELIPYATLIVAIAADRLVRTVPVGWLRTAAFSVLIVLLVVAGATARPLAPGRDDWRAAALEAMERYEGPDTLVVAYGPSSYALDQFWAIYTSDILAGRGPDLAAAGMVHVDLAGLATFDLQGHPQVIWLSGHYPMGDEPAAASAAAGFQCTRKGFSKAAVLDCRKAS